MEAATGFCGGADEVVVLSVGWHFPGGTPFLVKGTAHVKTQRPGSDSRKGQRPALPSCSWTVGGAQPSPMVSLRKQRWCCLGLWLGILLNIFHDPVQV